MSFNITNGILISSESNILEDYLTKDYFIDKFVDLQESIDNLIIIKDALAKVNYSNEAIQDLKYDPIFKQIIESNVDPKVALDLAIQAGYEGIVSDFFKFGFRPIGAHKNWYIGVNAKRIRKQLTRISSLSGDKLRFSPHAKWVTASMNLPDYNKTLSLIKGADALRQGCLLFTKNPKAGIAPVIAGLQKMGVRITEEAIVKKNYETDSSAKTGMILGFLVAGPLGMLVGGYLGNTKPEDKGFTPKKMIDVANQYLKVVGHIQEIRDIRPPEKVNTIPDIDKKIKFVSSASKVFGKTLKFLGDGIVATMWAIQQGY